MTYLSFKQISLCSKKALKFLSNKNWNLKIKRLLHHYALKLCLHKSVIRWNNLRIKIKRLQIRQLKNHPLQLTTEEIKSQNQFKLSKEGLKWYRKTINIREISNNREEYIRNENYILFYHIYKLEYIKGMIINLFYV